LALVFVLGTALRIKASREPPTGHDYYSGLGRNLHRHGTLGLSEPSALRGPLYPAFLALSQAAGVPDPRWAQTALVSAEIPLAGSLGALVATPLAGLCAALLVAVHPALVRSGNDFSIEPIFGFLLLAAAWGLAFWLRRPGRLRAWSAGFFISASLACRSVLVLFPVAFCGWLLADRRLAQSRRHAAAFLLASFIFLLPWVVRNAYHFQAFIPFERNLIAHNLAAASLGLTEFPKDPGYIERLYSEWGCSSRQSRDRCLADQALRGILAGPGRYLLSCAARLWHGVRLHLWLVVLAMIALAMHRKNPLVLALGLLCAYVFAVYSPFALVDRYFDPLLPCLLVLAGCAAAGAVERLWRGKPVPAPGPVGGQGRWTQGLLAAFLAVLYAASVGYLALEVARRAIPCRLPETALNLYHCGQALARSGDPARAASCYEQALRRAFLEGPPADILLGLGLGRRLGPGNPEAFSLLDEAARTQPSAAHSLALALQDQGDLAGAATLLERLARAHGSADILLDQGVMAFLRGSQAEGLRLFQSAAGLEPRNAKAHYHLGIAWERQGRRDKALEAFSRAVSLGTEQRRAGARPDTHLDDTLTLARDAQERLSRRP
jgi:tetratricopeptide (TPR) repeat protein